MIEQIVAHVPSGLTLTLLQESKEKKVLDRHRNLIMFSAVSQRQRYVTVEAMTLLQCISEILSSKLSPEFSRDFSQSL
jgi:hypothetical protein